jgi:uncharacterized protein
LAKPERGNNLLIQDNLPGASSNPSVPWTTRDVWWVTGLLFLIMFLIAVGVLLLNNIEIGLLLVGGELLLLIPVWWLGIRKYKISWSWVGLHRFALDSLALGCGLMVLSWGLNVIYGLFLSIFSLSIQQDYSTLFTDVSAAWGIMIGGAVVAPVVEEIIFRGFIFAGFRERYGWKTAALISSLLFAVIHFQPTAFLPIVVLGLIFAYLYQRSGSIWPAIIMHVSSNAIALGAAFLASELSIFPSM